MLFIGYATGSPGYETLNKFSHVIVGPVVFTSPTNMSLAFSAIDPDTGKTLGPWETDRSLHNAVIDVHNAGKKALLSIYVSSRKFNDAIFKNAGYQDRQTEMINSLVKWQNDYGLDGFDFDWEKTHHNNWDRNKWQGIISRLYNALPSGKNLLTQILIQAPADWDSSQWWYLQLTPETVQNYLVAANIMCYDPPADPPYSDLNWFKRQLEFFGNTVGLPKNKLCGGIRAYWYGPDKDHTYIAWSGIISGSYTKPNGNVFTIQIPNNAANSTSYTCNDGTSGILQGNGYDLAVNKAAFVTSQGYGGIMLYTMDGDNITSSRSLIKAILSQDIPSSPFPPGGAKAPKAKFTIKPAGVPASAKLWLGTVETIESASSEITGFNSTGSAQEFTFPITLPQTANTYHVYVDLTIGDLLYRKTLPDIIVR